MIEMTLSSRHRIRKSSPGPGRTPQAISYNRLLARVCAVNNWLIKTVQRCSPCGVLLLEKVYWVLFIIAPYNTCHILAIDVILFD